MRVRGAGDFPSVEAVRAENRSAVSWSSRPASTDCGSDGKAALIGVGDQQQILGERGQALRFLGCGAERRLEFGPASRTPQRQLELGPQQRERGPELVARVGDETPFVLDRRLQPAQHRVQSLGKTADLVPARGHREPEPGRLRRHGFCPAPHRLHGPQRRSGECVPGQRGQQQGDRACHRELEQQAVERVFAGRQGTRLEEDELSALAGHGEREHAPRRLPSAQAGCRQDAPRRPTSSIR